MSSRKITVDLGPMALSLQDVATGSACSLPAACADDALKFQSLMRRGADSSVGQSDGAADEAMDICPLDHLDVQEAEERVSSMDTVGDARTDRLAQEIAAVTQVSQIKPGGEPGDADEVRLALRPTLLRDAELAVTESMGRLEFSLIIGHHGDCQWLATGLPQLALTLSDRLQRSLRLQLFEGGPQPRLLAEGIWPPECAT